MNIKTITTIDGVNEVDFGSSASRFYWFRNIGTTAVHVSGKADIVAGGDGVAELAVGNSVCVEALGGKVYVLGAGKVEIYNTGDKFCPFKNAPAAGGGEVDAYTKSESDAKYAQKTDIPSSLPANGGNADTVGLRYSNDFLGKDYVYPTFAIYGFGADLNNYVTEYHGFIYNCDNSPIAHDYGFLDVSFFDGTGFSPSPSDKEGVVLQKFSRTDNCVFTRMRVANVWSEWKEISTTPIKSTTFSSTADGTGNFNLWAPSENKVPISIQLDNKTFYAIPFLYNNQMWLGSTINEVTRQPVTDTTVSGTVYYIEV